MNITAAYFNNGTLPQQGTKCEPDFPLFGGASGPAAALGPNTLGRRTAELNGNMVLLAALKKLGR